MQNIFKLKNKKMEKNVITKPANWIFTGCMFIGIAAGLYFNIVAVGTLAGMGVGFIARALMSNNQKENSNKKEIEI